MTRSRTVPGMMNASYNPIQTEPVMHHHSTPRVGSRPTPLALWSLVRGRRSDHRGIGQGPGPLPFTLTLVLAATVAGCAAPPVPRTLGDFRALSEGNAAAAPVAELTGIHPRKEWALLLWVERAHAARDAAPRGAPLFLNGVERLSPREAAALASFEGNRIFLPDLRALGAETGAALSSGGHELYLDGVVALDPRVAEVLVSARARALSLGGLRSLTSELAAILARHERGLRLHGLEELDVPAAAALSTWNGWGEAVLLSLGNLARLEPEVARALAGCTGWGLALDGVHELSPESARELGALDIPYLSLDGLEEVSPDTAREISRWRRKFLTLDGVTAIAPATRALIEAGCEAVSFRGIR